MRDPIDPCAIIDRAMSGSAHQGGSREGLRHDGPLFERDSELAEIRQFLDGLRETTCYLLSGDPGIGKTSLLRQIGHDAKGDGALVLSARCPEQIGAPPGWPWIEILRAIGRETERSGAEAILEPSEESEDSPNLATPVIATGRFRQFDAVARLLAELAREQPVLIALDDLHWADELSLRLLEHLVQSATPAPILVVATYRDAELSRHRPLGRSLNRLASNLLVRRVRLRGLGIDGTRKLIDAMRAEPLSDEVVGAIHRQTEGNPFFVNEIGRHLSESFGLMDGDSLPRVIKIPEGIRDVVSERLSRLSERCGQILEAASVLGRTFAQPTLERMFEDVGVEDLTRALDEAIQARIIVERPGEHTLEFAHALLRESIYDELSRTRRMRLHALAAKTLRNQRLDSQTTLVALANHWIESGLAGASEQAANCLTRAAEGAGRMLAYEDAAESLQQAIDCLATQDETTSDRVAELEARLGEMQHRAGRTEAALATFDRLASIAELRGDADLLARAAIAFEGSRWRVGLPAHDSTALLQRALERLPSNPSPRRVELLASLARARSYGLRERGESELALEAIAIARALDDATLLCDTLGTVYTALRRDPELAEQRLDCCREHLALATELRDDQRREQASEVLRVELLESAHFEEFDQLLAESREVCRRLQEPHHDYQLALCDAMRSLLHGRYDEVPTLARRAKRIGTLIQGSDAQGVYSLQMFTLFRDTGRLGEVEPVVEQMTQSNAHSLWGPGLALLFLELGQLDRAEQHFERLATRDFADVAADEMRLTSLAFVTEVCAELGDQRRAQTLYDQLRVHRGRLLVTGPGVACLGPVDRYLGLLAATFGDADGAGRHFAEAAAMAQSIDALPWLARCCHDAVGKGLEQQVGVDRPLDTARELAQRLGMSALLQSCDALRGRPRLGVGIEALTKRETEVLELLARGSSNKEIASTLFVSQATVATHVRNVLGKTGAKNRTEAAALALRAGMGGAQRVS